MRVLIVTPEYPPDFGGGIITFYRELVPALKALGHHVDVMVGSAFTHKDSEGSNSDLRYLESSRFHRFFREFASLEIFPQLRGFLAAAFAIHEQCKRGEGYDIVEVADWGMLFIPWVLQPECKVLVQMHGSSGQISHFEPRIGCEVSGIVELLFELEVLRQAPAVCSYSKANCDWWQKKVSKPVIYLPPPLSVTNEETELIHDDEQWVTAGRIQAWKGPETACRSWSILGDSAPILSWYGRDTEKGSTGQSTSSWLKQNYPNVWNRTIKPRGQVSPDDLKREFQSASTVIIPSHWDVFNYVGAEAMALGKVVIVSNGAGVSDLIDHSQNGFRFESENAESLSMCVRQVQGLSISERETLGRAARTTIRDRLSPILNAEEKFAIYQNVQFQRMENHWLRSAIDSGSAATIDNFLLGLPLKKLVNHSFNRMASKLGGLFR